MTGIIGAYWTSGLGLEWIFQVDLDDEYFDVA